MAFQKSENTTAYFKSGWMGFAGSGKTYTSTMIALGLHKMLTDRGLPGGGKTPIFFLDTEVGSDWSAELCRGVGVALHSDKTRAFTDLVPAIREVEQSNGILIIDSITHFWRELTESYAQKKNRTRGLEFQDWSWLKREWGGFTDAFINSACHIALCGRAGYEYDFFTNENGKRELEKTGIKMKAETETGYEPSLLVLMERVQSQKGDLTSIARQATVMKDRSAKLDGMQFLNPTFKDFAPHIECLHLGGHQLGVDTTRTSDAIIDDEQGRRDNSRETKCILDEIKEHLRAQHPGTGQAALKQKADMLDSCAGTRSWTRFETYDLSELRTAKNRLLGDAPPLLETAASEIPF